MAERLAERFLAVRGLVTICRNYRVRGGEIDLICRDGGTLVFVEVRLRRNPGFGSAAESIGRQKRRRIILAASHYLSAHPNAPCRFDCILLDALASARIEWLRNAFAADDA